MDWQGAMLARLRAAAGVTALVGTRTFWEEAPQDTPLPYVTLLDVGEVRGQLMTGWDLPFARVQIDVWASSYASKNAIMEAVLAALVPASTANGRTFQRAEIALGPRDVAGEREGTTTIFRKSADLVVAYQ